MSAISSRAGGSLIQSATADLAWDNSDGAISHAYALVQSWHDGTPTAGAPLTNLQNPGVDNLTKTGVTAGFGFQADGFVGNNGNYLNGPTADAVLAAGTANEMSLIVTARAKVTPSGDSNSQLMASLASGGRSINMLATNIWDLTCTIAHGNATRSVSTNDDAYIGTAPAYAARDTNDIFCGLSLSKPRRRFVAYVGHAGGFYAVESDFLSYDDALSILGGGVMRFFLKSNAAADITIGKSILISPHECSDDWFADRFEESRYMSRGNSGGGNLG